MINQLLPRFSTLIDLLKEKPLESTGEVMAVDPTGAIRRARNPEANRGFRYTLQPPELTMHL